MNNKNGFFGLVPPSATNAMLDAPAATISASEETWPLIQSLPLDADGDQARMTPVEKQAAWRVAPEPVHGLEDYSQPDPSKGELLAAGLHQMRQSQRTQRQHANTAPMHPHGQVPEITELKPQAVNADMTWPEQGIRVPISGEAQIPTPPIPAAAASTMQSMQAMTPEPAIAMVSSAPMARPSVSAQPSLPEVAPTSSQSVSEPAIGYAPVNASQTSMPARPDTDGHSAVPVPAMNEAAPSTVSTTAIDTPPLHTPDNTVQDSSIRQVFARLRRAATPAKPEVTPPLATAPAAHTPSRSGFLARLGKK